MRKFIATPLWTKIPAAKLNVELALAVCMHFKWKTDLINLLCIPWYDRNICSDVLSWDFDTNLWNILAPKRIHSPFFMVTVREKMYVNDDPMQPILVRICHHPKFFETKKRLYTQCHLRNKVGSGRHKT